jgi:hypothetical protein
VDSDFDAWWVIKFRAQKKRGFSFAREVDLGLFTSGVLVWFCLVCAWLGLLWLSVMRPANCSCGG